MSKFLRLSTAFLSLSFICSKNLMAADCQSTLGWADLNNYQNNYRHGALLNQLLSITIGDFAIIKGTGATKAGDEFFSVTELKLDNQITNSWKATLDVGNKQKNVFAYKVDKGTVVDAGGSEKVWDLDSQKKPPKNQQCTYTLSLHNNNKSLGNIGTLTVIRAWDEPKIKNTPLETVIKDLAKYVNNNKDDLGTGTFVKRMLEIQEGKEFTSTVSANTSLASIQLLVQEISTLDNILF
jgi:hypothetical protein